MSEQQVDINNLPIQMEEEAVEQKQSQPEEAPVVETTQKSEKPVKEKKPRAAKASHASHPTYFEMIKEALVALNEKSGSSPHAIAKFISEKHTDLPANFNKMLGVQLKNCTANGKLIKVKASFKLSDVSKKTVKSAVAKKKKPGKPKSSTAAVSKSRAVKKVLPKKKASAAAVKPKQVKSIKFATAKSAKVVPKGKKPVPAKASDDSHPTYFQMIKEAILALKERSGSSPHAIAKYMEENHSKILPANFKKLLAVQLKKCVANGKLIRVKSSFKLSDASKKDAKAAPKAVEKVKAVAEKKKPGPKTKAAAVVPKAKTGKKTATEAAPARKKPATAVAKRAGLGPATGAVAKKAGLKKPASGVAKKAAGVKKPAGFVAKKAGLKKPTGVIAKKAGLKKKAATPVKPKQPKSIRSPAAKRARRG